MKNQYLLLSVTLLLSHFPCFSQYYFYNDQYYDKPVIIELGASIGGMNCLTDLGGKNGTGKKFIKDLNLKNTRIGYGIYLNALYNQAIGLRLEAVWGEVTASDSVLKNDKGAGSSRYRRNLHFRSTIAEYSLLAELHFLQLINQHTYSCSPYFLGGIGVFHFNPEARLNNIWMPLNPLHTEGQGFKEFPGKNPYKLTQLNFPLGLGIRYEISAIVCARMELLYRFLSTDYLDDVSTSYISPVHFYNNLDAETAFLSKSLADRKAELEPGVYALPGEKRGNPLNKDAYFTLTVRLGIILNRSKK